MESNPLESLRTLRTPRAVIARGHLIEDLAIERIPEIDDYLDSF